MRIEKLKTRRGCPIHRLPEPLRSKVMMRRAFPIQRYERRHGHPASPQVYALMAGIAKRLVMAEAAGFDWSRWGHRMRAKKGGYAARRKFRAEGRNVGAYAARVSLQKQAAVKRARQPGFIRSWSANLDGI
jgi:hypothetical protein